MKKLWHILIVIICVNWVIIGIYFVKKMDFKGDKDTVPVLEEITLTDETYLDEVGSGEVSELVSEESLFSVWSLEEKYGDQVEQYVYLDPTVMSYEDLRYLEIPYYGFDGQVRLGELIVNVAVADEVIEIFKELFALKYPIEKMLTIHHYDGSDSLSMADNNSSAFNFREVTSGKKMSQHAYGLAIDLNPKINPYISNGIILPASGMHYANRDQEVIGMIKKGDPVYEAFVSRGWIWGGDWTSIKDYQHFEKKLN